MQVLLKEDNHPEKYAKSHNNGHFILHPDLLLAGGYPIRSTDHPANDRSGDDGHVACSVFRQTHLIMEKESPCMNCQNYMRKQIWLPDGASLAKSSKTRRHGMKIFPNPSCGSGMAPCRFIWNKTCWNMKREGG